METPGQPVDTGRHACTIGLKSLFKVINDRSPASGEARRYFEDTRPSVQCRKVLSEKTKCWLCGNGISVKVDNFSPHCEHVLPVAQGVIFLELYSKSSQNVSEAMELEYEWAHGTCNLLKNATVLIRGTGTYFEPDVDKINELLNSIRSRGIPVAQEHLYEVQGRLMQVTDYINRMPDYNINYLGSCPRKLVFKDGGKKMKRKHNGRTVRKSTTKGHGSNSGSRRKVRAGTRKRA